MAVHYEGRAGRAACGANQGVKYRHRVALTSVGDSVTCRACRRLVDVLGLDKPITDAEQADIDAFLLGAAAIQAKKAAR